MADPQVDRQNSPRHCEEAVEKLAHEAERSDRSMRKIANIVLVDRYSHFLGVLKMFRAGS